MDRRPRSFEHRQKRSRRRLVVIDEFKAMSTDPTLVERVSIFFKTFRTLGVGVWVMEQDVSTFVGLDAASGGNAVQQHAAQQILTNAQFCLALAHNSTAVPYLKAVYKQLTDAQLEELKRLNPKSSADQGRGLFIQSGGVYPLKIELTEYELHTLGGS